MVLRSWTQSFEFCGFMGLFWVLWKDHVVALYCLWFLFIVTFWWFSVFVICAFSSLLSMLSLDVHCLLLLVLLSLISSCCIFHLFSPSLITLLYTLYLLTWHSLRPLSCSLTLLRISSFRVSLYLLFLFPVFVLVARHLFFELTLFPRVLRLRQQPANRDRTRGHSALSKHCICHMLK